MIIFSLELVIRKKFHIRCLCFTIVWSIASVSISAATAEEASGAYPSSVLATSLDTESAIWVPTLNYRYNGQIIEDISPGNPNSSQAERWHQDRLPLLQNIYRVLKGPNVAFIKLDLIFEIRRGVYCLTQYELPYIFLSGWDAKRLGPDGETKMKAVRGLVRGIGSDICFVGTANEEINTRAAYLEHLQGIFSPTQYGSEKSTSLERVSNKIGLLEGYSKLIREDPSAKTEEFWSRFYDSEQAGFLKIREAFKTGTIALGELTKSIPEKARIHRIGVSIASHNDICCDCSDTAFRQMEAVRGFVESLTDSLFGCSAEYNIAGLSYHTTVSSVCPTHKPLMPEWRSRAYANDAEKFKAMGDGGLCDGTLLLVEKVSTQLPFVLQKNFDA